MEDSNLKQRILKVATYEFLTTGIKPVTMDNLSRKLKISKRTLYETFRDKEELLCECFVMHRKLCDRFIESSITDETNSLEIVALFFHYKMDEVNYLSPRFYFDLVRYPNVLKFLAERDRELKAERDAFFRRCIADGYFCDDINYHAIGEMLARQSMYLLTNNIPGEEALKALEAMFLVCIRGCCTAKGLEEFDRLVKVFSSKVQTTSPEILRQRLEEL